MKIRRLLLPCLFAAVMLLLWIVIVAYAAENIIENPTFDSNLDGWSHNGCARESKCDDIYVNCTAGEYIQQWVTPTIAGVYRMRWMKKMGGVDKFYVQLRGSSGESIGASFYEGGSCVWSGWKSLGLAADTRYLFKANGPAEHGLYMDDPTIEFYRDYVTHTYDIHNVITNAGFYGGYWGWTPGVGTPTYGANQGDDDPGRLYLEDSETVTQNVTVGYSGVYTYGFAMYAGGTGWGSMKIYSGGASIASQTDGPCAAYCYRQGTVSLTPGTYMVKLSGYSSGASFDDLYLWNPQEDFGLPPPPEWGENAWAYYPIEERADLGYYKVYGESSAYGRPYYNVWETTSDAYAYSIASMEIVDVGVNFLGYYVKAQIDAWPDIPSTTLIYEGLSSVSVYAGQKIGASCRIGMIADRWEFGGDTYHLPLGVFFPDEETPIDPRPYMTRYPTENSCQVYDGDGDDGPVYGTDPAGLWEPVCTDCVPPPLIELLIVGKWIDWLGCVITNLIQCTLVRLINSVIGFAYGLFASIIQAMGWITSTIGAAINWAGSLWNNVIVIGLANLATNALNALLQSGLFNMIWSTFQLVIVLWEYGKTFLLGILSLLKAAGVRFMTFFNQVNDFISAVQGIFDVQAVDIFDLYGFSETGGGESTGLSQVGEGGVLSTLLQAEGPNYAKVIWLVFFGIYYIDYQVVDQNPVFTIVIYVVYALTAWSVIWWLIKQFQDAAEEST